MVYADDGVVATLNNIGPAFAKVRSSFVVVVCGDDGVVATLNNSGTSFAKVRSSLWL